MHSEVFATRAVHLVHEVEHLDIELDMQQFADVREGVEETAVFSLKIDRHYVSLVLPGALNKVLLPFQVLDLPSMVDALEAAASARGKGQDVCLGLPHVLLAEGLFFAQRAGFADRRPEACDGFHEHQQFVDDDFEFAFLLARVVNHLCDNHAVQTT